MIIFYILLVVTGLAFVESSIDDTKNCTDNRINNGPLITPCLSEVILQNGHNYTMTCKGTTKLTFRQQDISEEVTSSNYTIVNKTSTIFEDVYTNEITLELYNVDRYAIGFYACTDEYADSNIVNSILEEPKNNEHVAYIYVYVNGTDSLFAPMTEIIMSRSNKILIECRPTTPDVTVELSSSSKSQNKTPKYSPKIGFVLKSCSNAFTCQGHRGDINATKNIRIFSDSGPPIPVITADSAYFIKNRQFTLNCSVVKPVNTIATLSWTYPEGLNMGSKDYKLDESQLYRAITIYNPTELHAGIYTCLAINGCLNTTSSFTKIFKPGDVLDLSLKGEKTIITFINGTASKNFRVDAYPEPTYKILKNGIEVLTFPGGKYSYKYNPQPKYVIFKITSCDITDNANFTLVASNNVTKNASFILQVKAGPTIDFGTNKKTCIKGTVTTISCNVAGFPIPNITWIFSNNTSKSYRENKTVYNVTAYLKLTCDQAGTIACHASNKIGNATEERKLLVYEVANGFGISDNRTAGAGADNSLEILQNDNLSIKCLASLFDFSNVTWFLNNDEEAKGMVEYPNRTKFSHVAVLKINNIELDHSGSYRCAGLRNNGTKTYEDITIEVIERKATVIEYPVDNIIEDVYRFEIKNINCVAVGAPLPTINWYKDDESIVQDKDNVKIHYKKLNSTTIQSIIEINQTQEYNLGKYDCVAQSDINIEKKSFTLNLKVDKEANMYVKHYVIAIVVIIIMLIILIVYLGVKIKKEKQFKKELSAAGLLYFKEGVTKSLNPDLGIDEQAELLPYDERFEFPADKLVYGKQLGAGAFGVVYKAEARGILNAEETTPVAVKMVKKTADNMYIKALASELKIMVHLGKHINIVNLLGACTKKVGKRELVVIVEYCKYGNIHNYMQRHREVFIDQLETDNKEKLGRVNRAYTSSSCGSTGAHSDYFGSTNTQDTEHTMLNTANTDRSVRKTSEGYVQPEWRSNYVTDYSYDGRSPRPLTSRDLLAWAFQIARGMEYLASRKVLHGDLAARNILLAEDNVVKICDFGLAKSIYKNDEYRTKENCLLPVKWLAIECMTDRIFSTQSDVWSFGIVLWELFTLAKTPYPNLSPADILPFLNEGHRPDKPAYADNRIYDVMKKCWEAKPTMRPTFTQLQETLGTFLEDNVRNHYVDLNNTNMDGNCKAGQDDYLAMVCAPDYNNLVTPSPHQYVNANNSFFPLTPDRVDGEGYLQMSPRNQGIFSPRDSNTEFTFDPIKLNHKTSESSCGSELTPMLSLNNLPARSGSESDHEGNSSYLSACPPIVEEADEVFEVTKNLNDSNNVKNLLQSAVTNPTYITFENINEKPKDIINNYVNINVPNGLVK